MAVIVDYSLTNITQWLQTPYSQDIVNGLFEFLGSFFIWLCVYRLYVDKELKGWSMWSTLYFTIWGYWNLIYYPSLNQWYSALATISIVTANTTWILLAFYYYRKNKLERKDETQISKT